MTGAARKIISDQNPKHSLFGLMSECMLHTIICMWTSDVFKSSSGFQKSRFLRKFKSYLSPLSPDPPCQLDVLGHDGNPLGMDGAQVGVLEKANEVGLGSLLKSGNSGTLEAQVCLEVLGNLAHQPLEGKLPNEELGGLLVATDFTESNSARPVTMRLFYTSGCWGALSGCLGGELLPRGLASSRLTGSLLGTSHCSGSGKLD